MLEFSAFEDRVVKHLIGEFELWVISDEQEYFLRKMQKLHKDWILSRLGRISEPKEKWRFLVATFEEELSRMREFRREEIVEQDLAA